jgi:hypothetical protein
MPPSSPDSPLQWKSSDLGIFFLQDTAVTAKAKLDAANVFHSIRKSVERDIAELSCLTTSDIRKKSSKFSLFEKNLKTLLSSADEAYDVLRPLSEESPVDKLIIGLYTTNATHRTSLHQHGLRTIFSALLDHDQYKLSFAARGHTMDLLVDACNTTGGQRSDSILRAVESDKQYRLYSKQKHRKRKKQRLAVTPAEIDDLQPLFLDLFPKNDKVNPFARAQYRGSFGRDDGTTEPQDSQALPSNDPASGCAPDAARRGNSHVSYQGPAVLPGRVPNSHGYHQPVGPGHGPINGPHDRPFNDRIMELDQILNDQETNMRIISDDIKFIDGVKYERKVNGLCSGKLVSSGTIIDIDGEDYVEYRVLTKLSFC